MSTEEVRFKFVQDTNKYVSDYIKLADAKVGALVAITGAIAGFASATVLEVAAMAAKYKYPILIFIICAAYFISVVCVFSCALMCLSPKTNPASSLHSFPDIAKMPLDQYVNEISKGDTPEFIMAFARHNFNLSNIAMQKFAWLDRAQRFSYGWIGALLLIFLMKIW